MKLPTLLLLAVSLATTSLAGDYPRVIFSDDFSSNGFGPRWGHLKSSSVVKDGILVGITAQDSGHPAVDSIKFLGERDLEVSVKFRFVSEQAKSFNVWFNDNDYKGSNGGHICQCTVSPTNVILADAKTGNFDLTGDLYQRSKKNNLTAEEKEKLATKRSAIPVKISLNEWHTLVVHTKGDAMTAAIDGKEIGTFKSEGISHETKSVVSLTTTRIDVHYDDISIKGLAKP